MSGNSGETDPRIILNGLNRVITAAPYVLSDAIDFFKSGNSKAPVRSHENRGTFHVSGERNFITVCLEPSGTAGPEKFRLNYERFAEEVDPELIKVRPSMANQVTDELNKRGITYLDFEFRNPGEGPRVYIMTGIEDSERKNAIVNALNSNHCYAGAFSPRELLNEFKDSGFVRFDRIEKDIYDQLEREKLLDFPHSVTKTEKGGIVFYSVTAPERFGDTLDRIVTGTGMYLSGSVREIAKQFHQERNDTLRDIYRALGDNNRSYIVVNGVNPDQRIMSDRNIIRIYRAGREQTAPEAVKEAQAAGFRAEQLYGRLDKQDGSHWQNELYKELGQYFAPVLIENDDKAPEKIRQIYDKDGFSRSKNTFQVINAKHLFAETLIDCAGMDQIRRMDPKSIREETEGIFYKDNQIRFANGIDHAVLIKDDNLKYDLRSDQALNERGKGGLTQVIDYSDLCDSFSQDYRETVEQTGHMTEKEYETGIRSIAEREASRVYSQYICACYGLTYEGQVPEDKKDIEYRMENSAGFKAITGLSKEARIFVIEDMDDAVAAVKNMIPDRITHESFENELDRSCRSNEYAPAPEENEPEFDL